MRKLQSECDICRIRIGAKVSFAGYTKGQDEEGNVTILIDDYLQRLSSIKPGKARGRERSADPNQRRSMNTTHWQVYSRIWVLQLIRRHLL